MYYTAQSKPGLGDPYWYEYTVGLNYLIDMLNPDNHIEYVEFQANVELGLDDIVITHNDGQTDFIQVKHTRVSDTLTFGDLVFQKSSSTGNLKISLLGELAKSWNEEKKEHQKSEIIIFTNKKIGNRTTCSKKDNTIKRPRLDYFLKELTDKINSTNEFCNIAFPDYKEAWSEWCEQLECISSDADKLYFLKHLHILTNQEDLNNLADTCKNKLKKIFKCSDQAAEHLLSNFDHALREWTVSTRKTSKIDVEEVYRVLSLNKETISYNQDLIPSDPFFSSRQDLVNKLENELKNGTNNILFLSGVPGIGKTNIISKLCYKRNSVVDIRYYAYEPIDPEKDYVPSDVSQRVDVNVFWNTLLNQLRNILKGKLYKYKVPVLNDFLTITEKKDEFFRIASEYAKDENKNFIIAIDGLDHAARSNNLENTFIPSLPHPDFLPKNIKILIAGQPQKNYNNYPIWLKNSNENVKEFTVPGITIEDIKNLVVSKCKSFDSTNQQLLSEVINKYANGNTLSAIFAVHEAEQCNNAQQLEAILIKRKLSGNIQEYYKTIWDNAIKEINSLFIDYKVAGVFSFFNEPVSAQKLKQIFIEENISESTWNNILKTLSPLLINHNGNYVILHNDVRVFLSSIIGLDEDHVKEIYSSLSDYYINSEEKTEGYYHDSLRYLSLCNRIDEFEKIYSPSYLVSAYVNGIDLSELLEETHFLLKHFIQKQDLDWNSLRSITLGYMTISQIEKSSYEIEDCNFRKNSKIINVHKYECFVIPQNSWNNDILSTAFSRICDLYENNEKQRSISMFCSWFSDINYHELKKYLNIDNNCILEETAEYITDSISKACVYTADYTLLNGIANEIKNGDNFASHLLKKTTNEIFKLYDLNIFSHSLKSLETYYISSIINGIKLSFIDNRLDKIKLVFKLCTNFIDEDPFDDVILAFLHIVNISEPWTDAQNIEIEKLNKKIEKIKIPNTSFLDELSYFTIYAIVFAFICEDNRSTISNKITEKYISNHNSLNKQYYSLYFNYSCFLGKWLKSKSQNNSILIPINELIILTENLFIKNQYRRDFTTESCVLQSLILKSFIMLSKKENKEFNQTLMKIFESNPSNNLLDPGFMFFSDNPTRIQEWIDEWLADDGKVWTMDLNTRNRVINDLIDCIKKYNLSNKINLRDVENKVKWSIIGFSSHKEYTVSNLLKWYNNLVVLNPNTIQEYSKKVKDMSDNIGLIADNRNEYILNCKFYSDNGTLGSANIKLILQNPKYLYQCIQNPEYLVELLIGYLRNAKLSRQQFLIVWGIGIGLLDWKNQDHHSFIYSLQKAIEIKAENCNLKNIYNDLYKIGPAYIDLQADSDFYIVSQQWFNQNETISRIENANELIEEYLTNNKINKNTVLDALKYLHQENKLNSFTIDKIITHELVTNEYGVYDNYILNFIMSISDISTINKGISSYLQNKLESKYFYPENDLPEIISWIMPYKDENFTKNSINALLDTYQCWITSDNHLTEPSSDKTFNYSTEIDLRDSNIFNIYVSILLMIVNSNEANDVRIALGGLFAIIRNDTTYISNIENQWNKMSYHAKEWIMMLYELFISLYPSLKNKLESLIFKHIHDDDFNVALYSKILYESFYSTNGNKLRIEKKDYFDQIPLLGSKYFIKTLDKSPWLSSTQYILKTINELETFLDDDLSDLETRTNAYNESINALPTLINLNRNNRAQIKLENNKTIYSFHRVMYKDWYQGRWNRNELDVARAILSATEPYYLFISPEKWKWNNGNLLNNTKDFQNLPETEKNSFIKEIFNLGIESDEIVISGSFTDYTYNDEIHCYLFSSIYNPFVQKALLSETSSMNSRLLFINKDDFTEYKPFNISLHYSGVRSFIESEIRCGLSKLALNAFEWSINLDVDGTKIVNKDHQTIGRLEYYYGNKNMNSYRTIYNQPILQRWVIKKTEFEKVLKECQIDNLTTISAVYKISKIL